MVVTLLGTNGFLSSAIARYCNKKGYALHLYGRSEQKDCMSETFMAIDLMNGELPIGEISKSDLIIYAIGAGIQSDLHDSCELIYTLNVTVPVKICNQLRAVGYKGKFITFGSVFEMGETQDEKFFSEEDIQTSLAVAPNDYTASKRMLTRFIGSYKHEFTHWHFIIPTIYGENENPKRLIPYTINALRNGEELHFTAGNQTRQYLYVQEVPIIIDQAFKKDIPSGIYNIQGKETLTVKELVTMVYHAMGKEIAEGCFGTATRTDIGMKYLALDGRKLKNAIGFEARTQILDVIKKY